MVFSFEWISCVQRTVIVTSVAVTINYRDVVFVPKTIHKFLLALKIIGYVE